MFISKIIDPYIRMIDVVALMLDNSPYYVPIWLGLAKAGATTALINSHLKGVPLVKTLQSTQAKFFIIGAEIMDRVTEAFRESSISLDSLGSSIFVTHGNYSGFTSLDPLIQANAM